MAEKHMFFTSESVTEGLSLIHILAVLSGPNHAEEIGRNLPAASVLSTRCV